MGTVVASVVAAGILWTLGILPIGVWAVTAWAALVYPIQVPLVILVGMIGTLLVVGWRAVLRALGPPPSPWLSYREDTFLGVVWRWSYDQTHHLVEQSICPYCPRCNTRLRGEQQGYAEITTAFLCDECGFKQYIPGNGDAVMSRIGRLIEREANKKAGRRAG
jgi:hypothetical protein